MVTTPKFCPTHVNILLYQRVRINLSGNKNKILIQFISASI